MKYRINQKDFRASEWKYDAKRKCFYSVCESLEGGRWEGFVTIRKSK